MKEIIIAMMMWIHTATGYSISEIPDINYLNTMELRSYAYGCELTPIPTHNIELCAAKKDWDLDRTNPIALYDDKNKTIIAHCPNSGSMLGLLDKDNKIFFGTFFYVLNFT